MNQWSDDTTLTHTHYVCIVYCAGAGRKPRTDSLRPEDRGNYTCRIDNDVSAQALDDNTNLQIRCKIMISIQVL